MCYNAEVLSVSYKANKQIPRVNLVFMFKKLFVAPEEAACNLMNFI